jgi:hypothetical protein
LLLVKLRKNITEISLKITYLPPPEAAQRRQIEKLQKNPGKPVFLM